MTSTSFGQPARAREASRTARRAAVALVAVLVTATLVVLLATPARAATFTVNTTNDSGPGSLRQAITDANANADADTINITAEGTINLQGELPQLSTAMQLNGPGADKLTVRRDAGGDYRIFTLPGNQANCCGNPGGPSVVLKGMTITNGKSPFGGGIKNGAYPDALTRSDLTLEKVAVVGNETTNGRGGGIYSGISKLTIRDSLISNNTGPNGTNGVGINIVSSTAGGIIANTTISGNSAPDAFGGGLYLGDGQTPVVNSTITNNGGGQFGSNVWLSTTFGRFYNTIIANPTGTSNCGISGSPGTSPTYSSSANNIEYPGTSCAFAAGGIGQTADPEIGTLAANGGPTDTHSIPTSSPAIDASLNSSPTTAADQRGVLKFDGDGNGSAIRDVGAFEYAPGPTLQLPQNVSVDPESLDGANVNYTATATGVDNQSVPVDCDPASGTLFPAGETTTVQCSATDPTTNVSKAGSFSVTVDKVDTNLGLDTVDTIDPGESATLSGNLASQFGNGLSGKQVILESRPASGGTFSNVETLTSGENGAFSTAVSPTENTLYRVRYEGTDALRSSESAATRLNVRTLVSLALSRAKARERQPVKISGSTTPALQGDIYLTIKRGTRTVRNGLPLALSDTSQYSYTFRPRSPGKYTITVLSVGDADHASGMATKQLKVIRR